MKIFLLSAAAALIFSAAHAQEYNVRGSSSDIDFDKLDTEDVQDMFLSDLSEDFDSEDFDSEDFEEEFDDEEFEFLEVSNRRCGRTRRDCYSDEICNINGRCVRQAGRGRRCNRTRDCRQGQECRRGRCRIETRGKRCRRRSDCGSNRRCIQGRCERRQFEEIMEEGLVAE